MLLSVTAVLDEGADDSGVLTGGSFRHYTAGSGMHVDLGGYVVAEHLGFLVAATQYSDAGFVAGGLNC